MTYFGAAGETKKQLQNALHLRDTDTKDELIKAFKMENFYQVGINSSFLGNHKVNSDTKSFKLQSRRRDLKIPHSMISE